MSAPTLSYLLTLAASSNPEQIIPFRNFVRTSVALAGQGSLRLDINALTAKWAGVTHFQLLPYFLTDVELSGQPDRDYDGVSLKASARSFINVFTGGNFNDITEVTDFLANSLDKLAIHIAAAHVEYIQITQGQDWNDADLIFQHLTNAMQVDGTFWRSTPSVAQSVSTFELVRASIAFDTSERNLYTCVLADYSRQIQFGLLIERAAFGQFMIYRVNPSNNHPSDALEFDSTMTAEQVLTILETYIYPVISTANPTSENIMALQVRLGLVGLAEYAGPLTHVAFLGAPVMVTNIPAGSSLPALSTGDTATGVGGNNGSGAGLVAGPSTDSGNGIIAGSDGLPYFTLPPMGRGGIISSDGSVPTSLIRGQDGNILTADPTALLGLKWATPQEVTGAGGAVMVDNGDGTYTFQGNSVTVVDTRASALPYTGSVAESTVSGAIDSVYSANLVTTNTANSALVAANAAPSTIDSLVAAAASGATDPDLQTATSIATLISALDAALTKLQ